MDSVVPVQSFQAWNSSTTLSKYRAANRAAFVLRISFTVETQDCGSSLSDKVISNLYKVTYITLRNIYAPFRKVNGHIRNLYGSQRKVNGLMGMYTV